jgi:hypothetical protein
MVQQKQETSKGSRQTRSSETVAKWHQPSRTLPATLALNYQSRECDSSGVQQHLKLANCSTVEVDRLRHVRAWLRIDTENRGSARLNHFRPRPYQQSVSNEDSAPCDMPFWFSCSGSGWAMLAASLYAGGLEMTFQGPHSVSPEPRRLGPPNFCSFIAAQGPPTFIMVLSRDPNHALSLIKIQD